MCAGCAVSSICSTGGASWVDSKTLCLLSVSVEVECLCKEREVMKEMRSESNVAVVACAGGSGSMRCVKYAR